MGFGVIIRIRIIRFSIKKDELVRQSNSHSLSLHTCSRPVDGAYQ
jgi:hypothetical protein